MKLVEKFAKAEKTLAAAVADDGTFTVDYPSGTSQSSFNSGLAGSGHYMIVNDNDKWENEDPGISVSFGATEITVTNLTGTSLAAGSEIVLMLDKVEDGNVVLLQIPVDLAAITAAGDVVTDIRPGVDGVIENVEFLVTKPVTTAAKAADLNLEIGTTNVTGGVVALTSAAATPLGKTIAGSAITAENTIKRDDKLSVEAANVTAFVEGTGLLLVRIRQGLPDAY